MTAPIKGARRVLHGWREYAADMLRHLIALTVAFTAVFLAISGGSLFTGSLEEFVGMLRVIAVMAVATLLGHGLVTRVRGHVSLIASGFFTWMPPSLRFSHYRCLERIERPLWRTFGSPSWWDYPSLP